MIGPRAARALLPAWWLLVAVPAVSAQVGSSGPPGASLKRATAVRLAGGISLDGRLNEAAWRAAPAISDFRMKEPVENGEPRDRTEVSFLYDDHALYVGARLFSASPKTIPHDLTRRDQYGNAEHIVISLDPYLDRRTSYSFSITAGGVRRDYYTPRDRDDFGIRDFTFDPVWSAKVAIDSSGWTAEIRIPFSQLRFNRKPVQQWGLNINRWIPNRNEDIFWVVVPRNETGFSSRFGTLSGIEGVKPSRRIEVLPYAATNGTFAGTSNAANPFDPDGRTVRGRAGADLKMGLGPNATLDATVNPDFGQVEADPAEVNLTAFETFFSERRPFFTEGSQLLRGTVDNYFYSRRIGARPRGPAWGDFVDRPENTTILGATKVTGRLANGLSLGGLAAATGREFARTFDVASGQRKETMIEPRAAYGVLRLQQQFGREASTVGAIVSGVNRGSLGHDSLPAYLSQRAVAGGMDWVLRFNQGRYEISGDIGGSYVAGDTAVIHRLQESSARYFQRPDYQHATVDPTRTSLRGWRGRLRWDKNAGNWLSGAEVSAESPGFETNDMGRSSTVDDIDMNADVNYRWTRPGRLFRRATLGIYTRSNWNFDRVRTNSYLRLFSSATLKNFFESRFNAGYSFRSLSDNLTRGGPLMATGGVIDADITLSSSYATATFWQGAVYVRKGELGDWGLGLFGSLSFRPTSAVSLGIEPIYRHVVETRQYVTTLADGPAATFGQRYVFGRINQHQVSGRIRVNYTFTPDLSLEVYAEPFAASGRYTAFGELAAARTRNLRAYGTDGTSITTQGSGYSVTDATTGRTFGFANPDFTALSFRSNLVLRWEWNPGSTLFLVWQQNRSTFCAPTTPDDCRGEMVAGTPVGIGALGDALRAVGNNFIAVKATYWIAVR